MGACMGACMGGRVPSLVKMSRHRSSTPTRGAPPGGRTTRKPGQNEEKSIKMNFFFRQQYQQLSPGFACFSPSKWCGTA
jgi:hypothetical protein